MAEIITSFFASSMQIICIRGCSCAYLVSCMPLYFAPLARTFSISDVFA